MMGKYPQTPKIGLETFGMRRPQSFHFPEMLCVWVCAAQVSELNAAKKHHFSMFVSWCTQSHCKKPVLSNKARLESEKVPFSLCCLSSFKTTNMCCHTEGRKSTRTQRLTVLSSICQNGADRVELTPSTRREARWALGGGGNHICILYMVPRPSQAQKFKCLGKVEQSKET